LKDAKILNEEGGLNACQLTQGTKATFLDLGSRAGVKFFEKHYASLQEKNEARENMLVAMYDSVFKDKDNFTIEKFEKTYLKSSLVASRLASESYAVDQLAKIIKDKNYGQIEQIFTYYTLLAERKSLKRFGRADSEDLRAQRHAVNERIALLQHDLSREDM